MARSISRSKRFITWRVIIIQKWKRFITCATRRFGGGWA